jgi:plasmid rolling circle replication initiator protein Rep
MAIAKTYHEIGKHDLEFKRIGTCMQECGTFLEFAITIDHVRRLVRANFCDTRLCPMCNWRKSKKLGHELERVMKIYRERHPAFSVVMLTLTERNVSGDDLGKTLDKISKGFSKLRHRPEWKRTVKASFRATEVTRARDGEYHPHMHILMFVSEEIAQSRWGELWEMSRDLDYHPIIDKKKVEDLPHWAKYVTKEQDHLDEEGEDGWSANAGVIRNLHIGLKRRRLNAWSRELSKIRNELSGEREEFIITHHETYHWQAFTAKRGTYWLTGSRMVTEWRKAA